MYIDPLAPTTFAEIVVETGDCSSYTDTASLIGPLGGAVPVTTYIGNATLPNGVSVTINYTNAFPAGLLAEGTYSLVPFLDFKLITGRSGNFQRDNANVERGDRHHSFSNNYQSAFHLYDNNLIYQVCNRNNHFKQRRGIDRHPSC